MTSTESIIDYSLSINENNIPTDILQIAKLAILDVLGCGLAGMSENTVKLLMEEALEEGGRPEATMFGYQQKVTRLQAARVNATASHILDFDDSAEVANSHLSSPLAHSLLALGQSIGVSGKNLLVAYIAGYEAACRIAQICNVADLYSKGWHATPVIGTLGVAIACCRLMNDSPEVMTNALGIAATQASGMKSMFGTMCKSLHAGEAASRGMRSALLAGRGFTSCANILEAPLGFAWCFSGKQPLETDSALSWDTWFLSRNLFKYHAACHLTHAFIEAAVALRTQYSLLPEEIKRIDLHASADCLDVCNIAEPKTGLEGKFSLCHTVAQALYGMNTADIGIYTAQNISHPELVALRSLINMVIEPERHRLSGRVDILTNNGRRLSIETSTAAGQDLEETSTRVCAKFTTLSEPLIGKPKTDRIQTEIFSLEQATTLDDLFDQMY